MNEAIKTLLNRRSIRKFKPEQIKDDELNIVLAYERENHKAEHSRTCKGDL
jgi:nitroreductase